MTRGLVFMLLICNALWIVARFSHDDEDEEDLLFGLLFLCLLDYA